MQIQFVSLYIVVISRPEDCKSDTSRLGVRKLAYLPLSVTVALYHTAARSCYGVSLATACKFLSDTPFFGLGLSICLASIPAMYAVL